VPVSNSEKKEKDIPVDFSIVIYFLLDLDFAYIASRTKTSDL
jgi:hypothetical protein